MIQKLWYEFCRVVCEAIFLPLFKLRVFNKENVPSEGGALIVSNHQSYFDPVLIGVGLPRQIHYMARSDLFDYRLFRLLIASLNAFAVRRGESDRGAVRETIERVSKGNMVLIFPEGTRTWDGAIGAMSRGLEFIARKGEVPIVPAAISGAYEAWPRTKMLFRPGWIKVAFGNPISVEEQRRFGRGELTEAIRERIARLYERLTA